VAVTSSIGTCTSNAATLTVENMPVITTQPLTQSVCSSNTTSITFSVAATSTSALSYQWQKNGVAISGATSGSYTATGLTLADTNNIYKVVVTNGVGSTTSNGASFKYVIVAQPTPASAYLVTGNAITFTATGSSVATAFQWKKDGTNISGAISPSYSIGTVNTSDTGSYTLNVSYTGGTCTSNAGVLTTSTVLYSKSTGNISNPATWGVATDGSGSSLLSVEERSIPAGNDTLHLSLTGTTTRNYQLELIPDHVDNVSMYLYDKYLNTLSPISQTPAALLLVLIQP
jgi:hypothetical protein